MADVSWLTPSNGATFSAGDPIHLQWKTSRPIVSPSFRLCLPSGPSTPRTRRSQDVAASDECGMAIWPIIKEEKGVYCTSVRVPDNLKAQHTFVLRMEDDFGAISESPCFSSAPHRSSVLTEKKNNDTSFDTSQAPFVAHTKSSPRHTSTADASRNSSSTATGSSATSSRPAAPPNSSHSSPPPLIPNTLLSHKPPNAASFAVPLAVVAAILLIAIFLAIRHRRKLAKERATDAEKLTLARQGNETILKEHDVTNETINDLSKDAPGPVPLFMPVDLPPVQIKRSHRKSVPVSSAYTNVNATLAVKNSVKSSRALSTRSTYSQASAYLPPIVPASQGLFDEEREDPTVHSVIADYFQPSPPISPSAPEPLPKAHVTD
ncbi:hypothetical protein FPV67DRAFT_1452917 [Lyophyllum atratum]|nr:hypothetical protein FPV67DRAFT_1452917 [Lyophyllum atratum]